MDHLILPDFRSHSAIITPSVALPPADIPEGRGNGTVLPDAFAAPATPYYVGNPTETLGVNEELILNGGVLKVVDGVLELDGVPVGGGGGGNVDSVSAGSGLVVSPTIGNVVVSMPNVGTSGTVENVSGISTDAQGRVVGLLSYGYVPQSAAQVNAAIGTAVAPLARLDGATFTGPVNTAGTTLTVATPLADAQAATKLYVDNAVAGITPGGAVNTVLGGSNISINSSNAASPIVNLDMTSFLDMKTNEINNCSAITSVVEGTLEVRGGEVNIVQTGTGLEAPEVSFPFPTVMNLTAGGAIGITAGGAVGMLAGGLVNMTAVGSASIFATGVGGLSGEVLLGGPINHITIESDGRSLSNVLDLKATGTITGSTAVITGNVTGVNLNALNGSVNALGEGLGQGTVNAASKVTAPLGEFTTLFTGEVQLGDNAGVNELTFVSNEPVSHIITAIEEGAAVGQVAGGVLDTRLNPLQATLTSNTLNLVAKNGANSNVTMATVDLAPALGAFLPLAGGNMTGALTVEETTNIESKNITTALLSPLPSIGFISALGPMQVEGGNFLVANGTATEIGLAATSSPPLDQIATIKYNHVADDLLHFNKVLEAPGAELDGNDVVPLLTFKDARTFFVSKQGSDTNSGAANAPFLTVQAALTAALATGVEAVVDVAPGTYTENITIPSVAGILIRGSLQNDRMVEGTILKGVIAVQVTGTDNLFNNQVVISGCFVSGIIRDTSSKQHTLIVDGCRIEGDAADGGEAIDVNMTSTDGRTFVRNSVLSQEAGSTGRNPVVQCNVGRLQMQECELTARDDASCVIVNGTAHLVRMYNCSLASTSPSANPDALLQITSTTASLHSVAQTLFQYISTTSKTTPGLLVSRASPGVVSVALTQVVFALAGTLATGNVVQFGAGTALVLFVSDNRSFNTPAGAFASLIQSGATVLPLTRVGETVVQSVNAASGALSVLGGTGIGVATVGSNITISATNNGTLTGVGAGTAIAVDNTNPAVPVISNTGVTRLIAGSNVSLSAETGEITISAVGGGGTSAVNSVSAGTGITLTGTAEDVIVNNAGVLSVGVGNGLVNSGTATAPVLAVAATGTVTFQDVSTVRVAASGTGDDFSSFGVYPRIGGAYVPPTEPSQLVPLQFVNDIETGVQSVSAGDASIQIGGTATAPTVSVAVSGVTGGSYTNAAITVGPDGRLTAAASGAPPVLSVSGTAAQIASTGGTAPVLSLVDTTVTPGSYTYTSLTVDSKGRLTAAASGAPPVLTTVNANSGAVTIAGGANVTIDDSVPGTITVNSTDSGGTVTSISGTADQIVVANGTTTPVVGLATFGAGEATYTFPASIAVDDFGRVISATTGSAPEVTTVNGNAGAVTIAAGANVTIDSTVPGTITVSASGGGGGGITSINGQTGSAITLQGSGQVTISNPSPDVIDFSVPDFVAAVEAGLGITIGGDALFPSVTANVAALQAGTGISITAQQNNEFLIEATGGGGGTITLTSTTIPGLGITDDGAGNFNLANTGVISAAPADSTIVVGGTASDITLQARPGGQVVSNLEFGGTFNAQNVAALTANTVLTTTATQSGMSGFVGFKGEGTQVSYALQAEDVQASDPGLKRVKLTSANTIVPGSLARIVDQFNPQTVAIPFATTAPSFVIAPGASITTAQTLIISQSIQPNATALTYLTPRTFGILGNITLNTSSAVPLRFTVTFQKNNGVERTMAATYLQNNAFMTVPVNNISVGLEDGTILPNDNITINVFAQTLTFGSSTTIVTAPPFIAAILSMLSLNA